MEGGRGSNEQKVRRGLKRCLALVKQVFYYLEEGEQKEKWRREWKGFVQCQDCLYSIISVSLNTISPPFSFPLLCQPVKGKVQITQVLKKQVSFLQFCHGNTDAFQRQFGRDRGHLDLVEGS